MIADGKLTEGFLYLCDGKIEGIDSRKAENVPVYDCTGLYVSPGFIDLHTHGAGGYAFLTDDAHEVARGCDFMLTHGTTTLLPTLSAAPFAQMRRAVAAVAEVKQKGLSRNNVLGAHLEGPYLSDKQSGAQSPAFLTSPVENDYRALIEEFGDAVARWTYAPERDENGAFCTYLTLHGIVASAGHTDATYKEMARAIDCGCRLVTHLYSCTSTVTRNRGFRSPGVIESAFLRDELNVEIIADGKHLPPELIRMIVKIKGEERTALITDSLQIAGTDVREGEMSGVPFLVEDGVCKLRDRSAFAGSVATADTLLRVMTRQCGYSVPAATGMLTRTPARILGVKKGELKKGYDADIAVFDENICVRHVFVGGKKVV